MSVWLDVVGIVAGIYAAAYAAYWTWSRTRKRVMWDYWVVKLLQKAEGELGSRLEMRLDGEVIENLTQVGIRIWNGGWVAIERKDFEKPMRIVLKGVEKVFSVDVVKRVPKDLGVEFGAVEKIGEGREVEIKELLLNPGAGFAVSVMISGRSREPSLEGMIVGVQEFERVEPEKERERVISAASWVVAVGTLLFGVISAYAEAVLRLHLGYGLLGVAVGVLGVSWLAVWAARQSGAGSSPS